MLHSPNRQAILSPRAYLIALLSIALLLGGIYFAKLSGADPNVYRNDFNVFYFAAREVSEGRDPYQHSLGDWTPYLYPPLLAELLLPLTLLPLSFAAYVWFMIGAGSLIVSIPMLTDLEKGTDEGANRISGSWALLPAILSLLLLGRFLLDNFSLGQVNIIVSALCIAHVFFFAKGKHLHSTIALAVAVSIKLTPAVLLVWHLSRRRFKFTAGCAAMTALLMTLSFAPFGTNARGAFDTFFNRTVKNEQGFDLAYAGNQSLRGAIERFNPSDDTPARAPIAYFVVAVSLVLLAIAAVASARSTDILIQVAPFFCCVVLLSPLSWKAHFVLLLLPAFALFKQSERSKRRRNFLLASLAAAFVCFNLTSPKIIGLKAAEWMDAHSMVFLGALIMFVACAAGGFVRKNADLPRLASR